MERNSRRYTALLAIKARWLLYVPPV